MATLAEAPAEYEKENAKRKKKGQAEKSLEDFAHIQASLENQRLEGDVMIGKVCVELSELGVWHVPIHDAIACQKRKVRDVKRVMKKKWLDAVGFEPHLSVTDLSKEV